MYDNDVLSSSSGLPGGKGVKNHPTCAQSTGIKGALRTVRDTLKAPASGHPLLAKMTSLALGSGYGLHAIVLGAFDAICHLVRDIVRLT